MINIIHRLSYSFIYPISQQLKSIMVNNFALKASSKISSSSVLMRHHSCLTQYPMCITLVILLLGLCPIVFCSPTPFSSSMDDQNKINYDSNGFPFHAASALLSPPVQRSLSESSSLWYVQPRAGANQFLLSHLNENELLAPKWFRKSHHAAADDDDSDTYAPSALFVNRRSTAGYHNGRFSNLKKRKQLNKPPMEVMNEIVNSIYLKR